MENKIISWDRQALLQFNKTILYIAGDSIQNAENVRTEIIEKMYPPDKYKVNNDGNYRAFELHRLRVAYYTATNGIRILRVRHTSTEPLPY